MSTENQKWDPKDPGAYWTTKASAAYAKAVPENVDDICLISQLAGDNAEYSTTCWTDALKQFFPVQVCLSGGATNCTHYEQPVSPATYIWGPTSIYNNKCATQVFVPIDISTSDWGSSAVIDGPTVTDCTNGKHFSVFQGTNTSRLVINPTYYPDDPSRVVTAAVAVTLTSPISGNTTEKGDASVPIKGALLSKMNQTYVTCQNPPTPVTKFTDDAGLSCDTYSYSIAADGNTSSTDEGNDNVAVKLCTLPKQWTSCPSGSSTNLSTLDSSKGKGAFIYRYQNTFFGVPVNKGTGVICEWASGDQRCSLLGGVIQPVDSVEDDLYEYQPSMFSNETQPPGLEPGTQTYYIPVSYSLFNPSGQDTTFLSQLLNPRCAADPGAGICSSALDTSGFESLGVLYSDLNRRIQDPDETDYAELVTVYFSYVCSQYYFLAVYNYFMNLGVVGRSSYWMFEQKAVWASVTELFQNGGIVDTPDFFEFMNDGLFQDARPVLSPYKQVSDTSGTIDVQLTIPSILFPLVFTDKTYKAVKKEALQMLLLRSFPETVPSGKGDMGFEGAIYYSADGGANADKVTSFALTPSNSPFIVGDADLGNAEFYWFSHAPDTPVKMSVGGYNPDKPPNSPLIAVRFHVTLQINHPQYEPETVRGVNKCPTSSSIVPSMSLFFYLRYLQEHPDVPIPNICNGMFFDKAVQEYALNPIPPATDWSQACKMLENGSCSPTDTRTLLFVGPESDVVNSLFLTPDSAPCACLYGSNLPPDFEDRKLNPGSMCFNKKCASPFCLANVVNNREQKNCNQGELNGTVDCTAYCKSYVDMFQQYKELLDLNSIDWNALDETCHVSIDQLLEKRPPKLEFVTSLTLASCAFPLLYLIVVIICAIQAKYVEGAPPFLQSLASRRWFWVPILLVSMLVIGGAVFTGTQLQGAPYCRTQVLSKGRYTVPSSSCRATGSLWSKIWGPTQFLTLPQDFCVDTNVSYCEHYDNGDGNKRSCTESEEKACWEQAPDGLCSASFTRPFTGRPVAISSEKVSWTPMILLLSCCILLIAVPSLTALTWLLMGPTVKRIGVRIAITVAVALIAAALSFTYTWLQLLVPRTVNTIVAGPCGALTGFPDTLVADTYPSSVKPAEGEEVVYVNTGKTFGGAPIYQMNVPLSGVPTYMYVPSDTMDFIMTNDAAEEGQDPKVLYVNDQYSPLLSVSEKYDVPIPFLRSTFTTKNEGDDDGFVFCGKKGTDSTCGDNPDCPCSPSSSIRDNSSIICGRSPPSSSGRLTESKMSGE